MIVSELIKELENIYATRGDLPVLFPAEGYLGDVEVTKMTYCDMTDALPKPTHGFVCYIILGGELT